jgi:hypothetical protein
VSALSGREKRLRLDMVGDGRWRDAAGFQAKPT